MSIAKEPDPATYRNFNDFFTRELRTGVRSVSVNKNEILCPVDGSISQIGKINSLDIIQAKNRSYTLDELLANDGLINHFRDGLFTTLYLSPRDYHRIHMPIDGKMIKMTYVPGKLFAVNKHSVKIVNRVFARNERVISYFDTDSGLMALVMVGAINVGSMETIWAGEITPQYKGKLFTKNYQKQQIQLQQGVEMGRFNMGSTVILLFEKNKIDWLPNLQAEQTIVMGTPLATKNNN